MYGSSSSVVVESNEFESKSESIWSESKSKYESSGSESKSESKSSWIISDLGIYVARETKNANFEKCNHKNLSTLKTVVTKLGLSHTCSKSVSNELRSGWKNKLFL